MSSRLYLPEEWISDADRMDKACIPVGYRGYKTKPELDLEIINEADRNGVAFDWIGGDGLYGYNSELTRALDSLVFFYFLDVHKKEHVYLEKPQLCVPEKKSARGRLPVRKQANTKPFSLESYRLGLGTQDWQKSECP